MRAVLVALVLGALASCSDDSADPCDRSVESNVDHLVALSGDAEAWDEYGAELFDRCPAKAALVTERIVALGEG